MVGNWTEEEELLNFSSVAPLLDTAKKWLETSWFNDTPTFLDLFPQARESSFSGSLIFFPAVKVIDSYQILRL